MEKTNVNNRLARGPRTQITGSEFLLIAVPVTREEFRESLRPLAKKIALIIFEKQQAEFKIHGKETPESAVDNREHLNSVQCGVHSLYSGKDAITA
jgi:hypothetical protein